jgi:outer membrane lipoprotein-sorting protein
VVSLGGCAIAPPTLRQPVSEDARAAIALLITRWHEFSDLRALADLTFERGGQRQRLSGVLLAKAPSSIRLEALSPFAQPLLLVTVHDGRLTAYNTATNEAVVAPATAESAARLLGLPFDPDDLVAVLAGLAVPPRDIRTAQLLPADDLGPSLEIVGAVNRQRVWMDFQTGVVRRLEIAGGRTDARVTYRRDGAGTLNGFDVTAAQDHVRGSVAYRNLALATGVDGERFTLTLPKDAKIQTLR